MNEKKKSHPPGARRRCDATTGRQGTHGRGSAGEDSATFEVLLAFAKFADLFLRPVVVAVVVKRDFDISPTL